MKNTMTTTIKVTSFLFASFILLGFSHADIYSQYSHEIGEIQKYEKSHNFEKGYVSAAFLIRKIRSDIGAGEEVSRIRSEHTKIMNEVVTETNYTKSGGVNLNKSFAGYIPSSDSSDPSDPSKASGYFAAIFSSSQEKREDVTRILQTNPKETSQFPMKVQQDYRALQSNLRNYVKDHASHIALMKEAGIKAFYFASKMIENKSKNRVSYSHLRQILNLVSGDLNFYGTQTITGCIETYYAKTENRESSSEDVRFVGLWGLIPFDISENVSNELSVHTRNPYTEKNCDSSSQSVRHRSGDTVTVNLSLLDLNAKEWFNYVSAMYGLAIQTQNLKDWGNPYFQD